MASKDKKASNKDKLSGADSNKDWPGAPVTQPANLPEGFKVKRSVTLPSLAIKKPGECHVLRFDSAMRVSDVMDKKKADDGTPRKPATIANVTELSTGEQFIFIVPTVVVKNLERDYKDDAYKGLIFQITNKGKRTEGQSYNDFSILELEAA